MILPVSTFSRPPLFMENISDERELMFSPKTIEDTILSGKDLRKLKEMFEMPGFNMMLHHIFCERKFDDRDQELVNAIREIILRTFAGKEIDEVVVVEDLSESQYLKYKKTTLVIKKIIGTCLSDQSFQEFIADSPNKGALFFEFIKAANLKIGFLKTLEGEVGLNRWFLKEFIDEIKRNEEFARGVILENFRISSEKMRLDAAEVLGASASVVAVSGALAGAGSDVSTGEGVSAVVVKTPSQLSADVDLKDKAIILEFIIEKYKCRLSYRKDPSPRWIIGQPEDKFRKDFRYFIDSLYGLSDSEGLIKRGELNYELEIYDFKKFFICRDSETGLETVKTLNNFLNLIYQIASVNEIAYRDGDVNYEASVNKALTMFSLSDVSELEDLRSCLLRDEYRGYFRESYREKHGFNFDYCLNNEFLEKELGNISLAVISFAFLEDKCFEFKPEEEGKTHAEKEGRKFRFYVGPVRDIPEFPGIELRKTPLESGVEFEFFVTNPVLATLNFTSFKEFFLGKHNEYFTKLHKRLEDGLNSVATILRSNLRPTARMDFPRKHTDFPRDPSEVGEVEFRFVRIILNTNNVGLKQYLIDNTKKFSALEFESFSDDNDKELSIIVRSSTNLLKDYEMLLKVIEEYNEKAEIERLDYLEAAKIEDDALLLALGGSDKKSRKPQAPSSVPSQKKLTAEEKASRAKEKKEAEEKGRRDEENKAAKAAFERFKVFIDRNQKILQEKLGINSSSLIDLSQNAEGLLFVSIPNIIDRENFFVKVILSFVAKRPQAIIVNILEPGTESDSAKLIISANYKDSIGGAVGELRKFLNEMIIEKELPLKKVVKKVVSDGKVGERKKREGVKKTADEVVVKEVIEASADSADKDAKVDEVLVAEIGLVALDDVVTDSAVKVFVAETGGTGSKTEFITVDELEASKGVLLVAGVKDDDEAVSSFNLQIKHCLDARKSFAGFNPEIMKDFPAELKTIIETLKTAEIVIQPAIYGGFIYGRNPKDLDFQIVMKNDFFTKKSDEEVMKGFGQLIPENLRSYIECRKYPITNEERTSNVWKVSIGEYVEFTFIEERDHLLNQNWTTTQDAKVFDLKTNSMQYQPSFSYAVGYAADPVPFLINHRSKEWPFRLIYGIFPNQIHQDHANLALGKIVHNLSIPDLEADGSKKTFLSKLEEKLQQFKQKHKICGEEEVFFDNNMAQILRETFRRVSLFNEHGIMVRRQSFSPNVSHLASEFSEINSKITTLEKPYLDLVKKSSSVRSAVAPETAVMVAGGVNVKAGQRQSCRK